MARAWGEVGGSWMWRWFGGGGRWGGVLGGAWEV